MLNCEIVRVFGDGSGPELMEVACPIVEAAALEFNDLVIEWVDVDMGWSALEQYGDTYPEAARQAAMDCGTVYFGGVGDPALDRTIGASLPGMKPEGHTLLGLRHDMGLLVNGRPLFIPFALRHATKLRPDFIPESGINQWWLRYLPEDGYYGTRDLISEIPVETALALGIKLKADVTGDERLLTELAYFTRKNIAAFARFGFEFACTLGVDVIDIHKANILARSAYWKMVVDQIHAAEFPDVPMRDLYVDAAASMLYDPRQFNGVMLCGNEHGDIISDGALGAFSMGMMSSFAINPETGAGMFESGAGTCPDLAGLDVANPIGRILTGALMLRFGRNKAPEAADAIEKAVWKTLESGWRTKDIASACDDPALVIGTREMGETILSFLKPS